MIERIVMDKIVKLQLPDLMIGQILDGLEQQQHIWQATAHFLLTGEPPDDVLVAECSREEEANWIAGFYDEIILEIRRQIRE
jgi:hypothetical protein